MQITFCDQCDIGIYFLVDPLAVNTVPDEFLESIFALLKNILEHRSRHHTFLDIRRQFIVDIEGDKAAVIMLHKLAQLNGNTAGDIDTVNFIVIFLK